MKDGWHNVENGLKITTMGLIEYNVNEKKIYIYDFWLAFIKYYKALERGELYLWKAYTIYLYISTCEKQITAALLCGIQLFDIHLNT